MTRRDQQRCAGRLRLCTVLVALVIAIAEAGTAHAGTIWIQWDRSTDPAVVGYRVSVGTSPGVYTETFDVGSLTSFLYQTSDSRLHYLAVASYSAGRQVGPLSAAVSAYPRPMPTQALPPGVNDPRSFYGYLWSSASSASGVGTVSASNSGRRLGLAGITAAATACWAPSTECVAMRTVLRRDAAITALAASPDGRLFFIEDGQRIRVIASNVLGSGSFQADAGVRLHGIGFDPLFAATGDIYVGETETYADGSREFRIARYRVAQNLVGDRHVVISLPLPFAADGAVFAIGSTGHIYVAMPAAVNALQQTSHTGMLLRFNTDGSVPAEQEGSAVFATGYARPTAIAFDPETERLWLAGADDLDRPSVSSLGERTSPLSAPAASLAASSGANGGPYLYAASDSGGLGRALVDSDGSLTSAGQLAFGDGLVRSVAAGRGGELFVAVAVPSDAGTMTSIVRLTPIQ